MREFLRWNVRIRFSVIKFRRVTGVALCEKNFFIACFDCGRSVTEYVLLSRYFGSVLVFVKYVERYKAVARYSAERQRYFRGSRRGYYLVDNAVLYLFAVETKLPFTVRTSVLKNLYVFVRRSVLPPDTTDLTGLYACFISSAPVWSVRSGNTRPSTQKFCRAFLRRGRRRRCIRTCTFIILAMVYRMVAPFPYTAAHKLVA